MADQSSKEQQEGIRRYYDDVYYREVPEIPRASRQHYQIADRLRIRPGQRVLDVACGTGNWLLAAEQRGAIPAGIDLSVRAIEVCRRAIPNGRFETGSAEELPFEDAAFDLVTCFGSLEHFLDPVRALVEMRRVAKSSAGFLFVVPNSGFLTRRLGLYGGTGQAEVREVWRSLYEWEALFAEAGLKVDKRWKDLHVLSWDWIALNGFTGIPLRLAQALALPLWPLSWQYQVIFVCSSR